ncbi:hypothetical protein NM688_g8662 [Phlebia brevispora]|uniref:Uncharacterized protein n=1 Tax=Phlebia brevispora TaxID=194682 RepID=A0ACC1RR68_9APHY|nr:hypothetical protein NM688_g8662 [Phlebia brevispora]
MPPPPDAREAPTPSVPTLLGIWALAESHGSAWDSATRAQARQVHVTSSTRFDANHHLRDGDAGTQSTTRALATGQSMSEFNTAIFLQPAGKARGLRGVLVRVPPLCNDLSSPSINPAGDPHIFHTPRRDSHRDTTDQALYMLA